MSQERGPEVTRLLTENERLRLKLGALANVVGLACGSRLTERDILLADAAWDAKALLAGATDEERRASDELHGCWECGTSDMRGDVCAEHEPLRGTE